MAETDIRWRQRLENYARALRLLSSALANGPQVLNDLEKGRIIFRRLLD